MEKKIRSFIQKNKDEFEHMLKNCPLSEAQKSYLQGAINALNIVTSGLDVIVACNGGK